MVSHGETLYAKMSLNNSDHMVFEESYKNGTAQGILFFDTKQAGNWQGSNTFHIKIEALPLQ